MKAFLELTRLSKSFPGKEGEPVCVVQDFDLKVKEGEFVSIVGHSGCGKSTVLSMLAGLTPSTSGGVILAGREVTEPGRDRGMVFQSPCLFPWMSTRENILIGIREAHRKLSKVEQIQMADDYLECVGLKGAGNRMPTELSQGMRQRVGIARAFALRPKVLLLDEPFGMLDSLTRLELQEVLLTVWEREKTTAILVTHDVDESLYLSDRIVLMTSGPAARVGRIVELDWPRPRVRDSLLVMPEYELVREELLSFLHGAEAHVPAH